MEEEEELSRNREGLGEKRKRQFARE